MYDLFSPKDLITNENYEKLCMTLDNLKDVFDSLIVDCDGECINCCGGDYNRDQMSVVENEDVCCVYDAIEVVKREYKKALEIIEEREL